MSCSKTLDFAVSGAHLSFYWTMDEFGAADKLDSTVNLPWPLENGALAGVGLFSNGTHCDPTLFLDHHRGLRMLANASVAINQAVSKGISVWFWVKVLAFGPEGGASFYMDTSDFAHTNRFELIWGSNDATHTGFELQHINDTDSNFVDTPNLSWALNEWHMVAITYNKVAQTMNVYIDGVLSVSGPDLSVYPNLTSTDMELANATAPFGTQDFMVDECGLCLNGPLIPAQITALWNGGAGVTWPGVTAIVPYP